MSTAYPASLDTAATLYDVVNNASSTLSSGYTAGGATIDLASAALFPSTGGVIYVGGERTTYTGKSANQLTGVTGLGNNYPSGTVAAMYLDADHHNTLRTAIVALETAIGATGSVVAGTVVKRLTDVEASASPVATQIHAATSKAVPEDADEVCLADNAGAWALKKSTWTQVKAFLKTYFDTLHVTIGGALGTPSSGTLTNCTGLPVAGGGTGRATSTTAYGLLAAGTTATGAHQTLAAGATTDILVGGGASALPAWTAATGSGAPVRQTSPTLTTPVISSISNSGTLTLPSGSSDTLVGRATTDTLTNKRVTPRVGSAASSATPTINTDNVDIYKLTAQTVDITSFTTNLSGTPTDGQVLIIQITGTAARAITWGASFEASTVALPTTTVTTAMLSVGFLWNTATSKWRCMAVV